MLYQLSYIRNWSPTRPPNRHTVHEDRSMHAPMCTTHASTCAAGEDRTSDLRIMRSTRCQLRYCRLGAVRFCMTSRVHAHMPCHEGVSGWGIQTPEDKSPKPQSPKPKAQRRMPEAQHPKARSQKHNAQSPKPKSPKPKVKAQSPKPKAQSLNCNCLDATRCCV